MSKKILALLKIYLPSIGYLFLVTFLYSVYLLKTGNDSNLIFELTLGITAFLLLGLLYGNMIHKKGLIVGLLVGISHLLLIHLILFLATGKFEISWILTIIYLISSMIGGFLGINFKKRI